MPAAERQMEPSPNPPWRVLEAPLADGSPRSPGTPPTSDATGLPIAVKVAAIIGAAAICAALGVVVAVSGSGGGTVVVEGGSPLTIAGSPSVTGSPLASSGAELVVEIVGAVPKPGVYRVPAGSRLVDLLQLAGGYGPRVDTARAETELNLAAPITDGDHIRVPSRDDPADASAGPAASSGRSVAAGGALVDINTATQAQLEELPGVGPATAQKIIAAREEARFGAVEELRSRGVLGEKTYEKLRPLLTVG
jgi:competence protein ComEA